MSRKKITHKQSKYFTIMLIPDSAVRVQSLKIPHWMFYVLGGVMALILSVVVIYKIQASYFQGLSNESNLQLQATMKEKEELEGEKTQLLSTFEKEKEELLNEKESVENKIEEFETRVYDLQEKIDTIDSLKEDIYNKIGELQDKGAPIVTTFAGDDDGSMPMGGPYIAVEETDSFGVVLAKLESKLESDIAELEYLKEAVNDIQPFIRSYPTGWPVSGRITSEFGVRGNPFGGSGIEGHTGLDIKASIGTPVAVTADGRVTFSGVQGGYGNLVIIDHGYGYSTYYAHNSQLLVTEGQKVNRGEIVALSGNTGRSTGPHVHYEVRLNDMPQNPREYLND